MNKVKKIVNKDETRQFIRFCIVGSICFLIDAAVYYVMRRLVHYQVALVSSYLVSLCFNYFLTIYWTFKTTPSIQNLVGVIGAHLFNLFVVREGLMWLFVEVFEIYDSIAYIPMAIISAVTNFLVIRFVVRKAK
jgi:putative flippase GtrA